VFGAKLAASHPSELDGWSEAIPIAPRDGETPTALILKSGPLGRVSKDGDKYGRG